jgi:exodeoxyribonuclease VII large subunit
VAHTRARLLALSPAATLRRGYAIVQRADGTVVRSAAQVAAAERITIRLAEDQLTAVAEAEQPNQSAAGQDSTRDS